MDFNNLQDIKKSGFSGFKTIRELCTDCSSIPRDKGVYLIIYQAKNDPSFLKEGTGGYFKGKNPNVPIAFLRYHWVKESIVIYIGKAGKDGSDATLYSRLKQYLSFGQGKNVGHYGGRLIWQLNNSKDLIVCWKTLQNEDPRTFEAMLIEQFVIKYSKRPFANLAD